MARSESREGRDPIATSFGKQVQRRARRKIIARQRANHTVWFGLGMFGLVGWSIAVPTLIGVAIGIWLDERWPGQVSWTLTLLILGVGLGCLNAWYWLKQEGAEHNGQPDEHPGEPSTQQRENDK